MQTRFTRGARVKLAGAKPLQGLQPGTVYVVRRVVVEHTPFGGFTGYELVPAEVHDHDAHPQSVEYLRDGGIQVLNGHLILTEA